MVTVTIALAAVVGYLVGVKDRSVDIKSAILVAVMGVILQVMAGAFVGVQ